MSINPKQIIKAWATSFNPNTDEKELADLRKKICDSCPSKKEVLKNKKWSAVCSECGCPISKKVFTIEFNPCPLKKWEPVDEKFFLKQQNKENKTVI